ncbi:hypothetical protein [Pseudomonas citri]|uniref:hypothetical protein n=1 Tax=Pseudomonas citri TaxID=2978349 RepID=UPI0021B6E2BD|nr:hypothetical protein [Pseudomonas citri]
MFKGLLHLVPSATLLLALCSTADAEDSKRVFTGTLGKIPIVLELSTQPVNSVTGRYFYEKYHRDLELSGSRQEDTLTLTEGNTRYGDDKPQPTLMLQETGNGWQGEWKSPEGKVLPIQLNEARPPVPAADALPFIAALAQSDPYEYLRLRGLKLKPGKKDSFMGHDLQWWTQPESSLSMFSIESGYPPASQQRINQQLLGRLWSEVISYHECLLQSSENSEFDQDVSPQFLSPEVVSLNISTRYYCGGAHPDFVSSPINLDVRTGRSLSLEDVLWVGKGKPLLRVDSASSGEEDSAQTTYQREVLTPWLIKQFTTLYPNEMRKPTDEDGCDYTEESIWDYSNWHFTAEGLLLLPSFGRVQRNCDDPGWSVLPYAVVKQYPGAVKLQLPEG